MRFIDLVDDYIFRDRWVFDDVDFDRIFFVKILEIFVIFYRIFVLNEWKLWKGKMK